MSRRWTWFTAAATACLAFGVRLNGALNYAFWQDEVTSARILLERTPVGVLRHVARTESTPPLFYVVGWLIHRVGVPAQDVRIVSALAGAVLAGATVILARRVVPLWASALAGLAVALGYEFVFHGRELRAYELHALLTVSLAFAALSFVDRPGRRTAIVLALVTAAGALTNYFFLLSVAAVLLWTWTRPLLRPVRRQLSLAIGAGLIPFAAWTPVLAFQYRRHRFSFIGPFRLHDVVTSYWSLVARAEPRTSVLHTAAPLLLAAAVLAGCVAVARRSDAGRLYALLALAPLLAAALVWLAGPRIFDTRNLIGVGPFAAIAVAALLSQLPRPVGVAAACAGAALVVFGFVQGQRQAPIAFDRIARALVSEGWQRSDPISLHGNFYAFRSPLEWYLPEQPALTLGLPRGVPCPRVFVISHGTVRQLRNARPTGRLLVATQGHGGCVTAVPERLLRARLGG
jgi:mannosyltransferase